MSDRFVRTVGAPTFDLFFVSVLSSRTRRYSSERANCFQIWSLIVPDGFPVNDVPRYYGLSNSFIIPAMSDFNSV